MLDPAMGRGFNTREAIEDYIAASNKSPAEFLFGALAAVAVEICR